MKAEAQPPSGDRESFAEMVELAQRGSMEALGKVLESCRHVLTRAARRQIPPDIQAKGAASDLVQETFLEAQRDLHQFSGSSRDELLAWLSRILHNNCANFVASYRDGGKRRIAREVSLDDRSLSRQLKDTLPGSGPGPSKLAIAREEAVLVSYALQALPEHNRAVVQLRVTQHLSFKEIGDRLSCSEEAARKVFTRTLRQLKASYPTSEQPDR
jgi:RNA polymerase sigma-70 factor (ECF subfamily)